MIKSAAPFLTLVVAGEITHCGFVDDVRLYLYIVHTGSLVPERGIGGAVISTHIEISNLEVQGARLRPPVENHFGVASSRCHGPRADKTMQS